MLESFRDLRIISTELDMAARDPATQKCETDALEFVREFIHSKRHLIFFNYQKYFSMNIWATEPSFVDAKT